MNEQVYRERECIHRAQGDAGEFYRGSIYIKQLQRLGPAAAMKLSSRVSSFFWADAARIVVWLCRDCAAELGLAERGAGA